MAKNLIAPADYIAGIVKFKHVMLQIRGIVVEKLLGITEPGRCFYLQITIHLLSRRVKLLFIYYYFILGIDRDGGIEVR